MRTFTVTRKAAVAVVLCAIQVFALSSTSGATNFSTKASGKATVSNKYGRTITVSPTKGIPNTGKWITVTGKGYDERVGIYVTLCVKPKAGKMPTPCGGGINRSGNSAASVWISSNPPRYGIGLAKPYGIGGKFSTKIFIGPYIGKLDCRKISCVVVTRADHIQPENRKSDVLVPVTFAK